jgi:acetyltransferase-like isoleucine patch superfamily enzyme
MEPCKLGQIHPIAIISEKAKISKSVTISANAIIHDNVEIGDNVFIGPNSVIGEPLSSYYRDRNYVNPKLVIGPNSIVRSGAFLYAGSTIGEGFQCGTSVTIREGARIGCHCSVGTSSDIEGDCRIGDYVRVHSNVHIAQKTDIGNYVWIYPYTVFTNDPTPPSNQLTGATVDDFAVIATNVVVMPGVRIGKDALVSAMSLVRWDVPPESVVAGNPAKRVGHIRYLRSKDSGEPLYPWRMRFSHYMPWENIGFAEWAKREKSWAE